MLSRRLKQVTVFIYSKNVFVKHLLSAHTLLGKKGKTTDKINKHYIEHLKGARIQRSSLRGSERNKRAGSTQSLLFDWGRGEWVLVMGMMVKARMKILISEKTKSCWERLKMKKRTLLQIKLYSSRLTCKRNQFLRHKKLKSTMYYKLWLISVA